MKTLPPLIVVTCLLLAGSGCQHAGTPSLKMQEKFFSSLEPANPAVDQTLRRIQYYQLTGRVDTAIQELQGALKNYPNNIRLLNALGNCHDRLGAYSQAKETYEKILLQDPSNQLALNNLGYSCFLAGDLVQAEKCFQEVIARNPENNLARNNLGLVWCSQGKEQQALNFWEKTEGEVLAREKLTQVLAHLGKTKGPAAKAAPAAEPRIPASSPSPPDKPDTPAPAPEIARLDHKQVSPRSPMPAPEDDRSESGQAAQGTRMPGIKLLKPQVTVEEVEMVVQPAAYSPGRLSREAPDRSGQNFGQLDAVPDTRGSGRKKPQVRPGGLEVQTPQDDTGRVEPASPPRRGVKRSAKIIHLAPGSCLKPTRPLQEYIATGFTHYWYKSARPLEMAVY